MEFKFYRGLCSILCDKLRTYTRAYLRHSITAMIYIRVRNYIYQDLGDSERTYNVSNLLLCLKIACTSALPPPSLLLLSYVLIF